MFVEACRKAAEFTRPLVVSSVRQDGTVGTECSTFIVINKDGWIVSAAHVFDSFVKFQTDQNKIREIKEINESRKGLLKTPSSEIKLDPALLTHHSMWWGWDGVNLRDVYVNRQIDVAVGRLEPFDSSWVKEYPVLIDPRRAARGTSLCRIGYAFLEIGSEFKEELNAFSIPKIDSERALFPNECIHTRSIDQGVSKDGGYRMDYIETSTPGLKGQSGGPILDRDGKLYAVQVKTSHLPLGFHPVASYDGNNMVENQFLNLGVGVSMTTVRQILDERGVNYAAEDRERKGSEYRIIG